MLFPQVYSFFLAGGFQFSFRSAPLSAHFVYLYCAILDCVIIRVSNFIDLILYVFCLFF